ncbi:MAG: XkdX family protein [Synergistaceae bacterium]|nr:XkdX family protein [Synergistaceae bacterium]
MSEFAMRVKKYYLLGIWSEVRVKAAVKAGKLTSEEYEAITGEGYVE